MNSKHRIMNLTLFFCYPNKQKLFKCLDILYVFVFLVIYISSTNSLCESVSKDHASISLRDCRVYGPGLNANFTVPVRYFFIQLVDSKNGR